MTRTPLYVTAQRWSTTLIEQLRGQATGIVLGDLFCQKRMFENEWFDVVDLAGCARGMGLEVVFQTPAYNTTRTIEPTLALMRKLAAAGLMQAILVHDIGILDAARELHGVELWWDRFSFNRDFIPNAPLMSFLKQQGISRVEVTRPAHVHSVDDSGCPVLLYAYGPEIASFGRTCYTEQFLNESCERKILCARSKPFIASIDKVPLQYLADGYTLLDREASEVHLGVFEPGLGARLSGMTAYVRGPEEIAPMRAAIDALEAG
jgi:hypothetical protein